MKQYISVAIDGPSGAGKSTLSRAAADALGFLYVDTGAIYRTVALRVERARVSPDDIPAVLALLDQIDIRMSYGADGLQHMFLDGTDVTHEIRRHEISQLASRISAIGGVREFLLEFQRRQARENHVIMDGRDIGTVVLPDAQVKVFLTATPEERARRRHKELLERGEQATLETVLADINRRDAQDSGRAVAPLQQAQDAALLDTTGLSFAQSLEALLALIGAVNRDE